MSHFGKIIARHRKRLRLSQDELATRAEMSRSWIQMVERSVEMPSIRGKSYRALARALETTTEDIDAEYGAGTTAAGKKIPILTVSGQGRTITLPPDLVAKLVERADAAGLDVLDFIAQSMRDRAPDEPRIANDDPPRHLPTAIIPPAGDPRFVGGED